MLDPWASHNASVQPDTPSRLDKFPRWPTSCPPFPLLSMRVVVHLSPKWSFAILLLGYVYKRNRRGRKDPHGSFAHSLAARDPKLRCPSLSQYEFTRSLIMKIWAREICWGWMRREWCNPVCARSLARRAKLWRSPMVILRAMYIEKAPPIYSMSPPSGRTAR